MSLSLWLFLAVVLALGATGWWFSRPRRRTAPPPPSTPPAEGLRLNFPPLHYAVFKNDFNAVNRLLGEGASPCQAMADGQTPLHVAAECNLPRMCELLLKQGAQVNAPDSFSGTPLHTAVAFQTDLEVVKILVGYGANIHLKDADGLTPLALAEKYGHFKIAAYLKTRGA